jgi:hypothetical protein
MKENELPEFARSLRSTSAIAARRTQSQEGWLTAEYTEHAEEDQGRNMGAEK